MNPGSWTVFKKIALFILFSSLVHGEEEKMNKLHALYLMQADKIDAAIEKYQEISKKEGPDFEILRQMSLLLMKHGVKTKDAESLLLSIYGAGLAASSSSLEILEQGLFVEDPQIQMMALYFIAQMNDDYCDDLLQKAQSSSFLSTRIEACFHMAIKKHPLATAHIQALMQHLPPMFLPYFPPLFALVGTGEAIAILHKLLEDPMPAVRVEAIHSLVQFGRDDFIPLIRKSLTHSDIAEKEASAYALGLLKDTSSHTELKKLSSISSENVRLAALKALYLLGDYSAKEEIERMAREHNLFAIFSLGDIPGSEDLLAQFLYSTHLPSRLNAALALLQRKDKRCMPMLREIFLADTRDLAFQPASSIGRAHHCIRVISSATQRSKKDPFFDADISLAMREHFLSQAFHLEEEAFLSLAKTIFDAKQNDLIPRLIHLLEMLSSEKAVLLLKEQTQKIGAPLIRNYCNLALFKLKEEGPYEENLIHWIMRQKDNYMIRLRPMLPIKSRKEISEYSLSAEETSRLLIDSYAALASRQDQKSIDIVLNALKIGNEKNRYALAGLLMRATE